MRRWLPSGFCITKLTCRHVAGSGSIASARSESETSGLRARTRSPTRRSWIGFVTNFVVGVVGTRITLACSGCAGLDVPESPDHKNPPPISKQAHIHARPSIETFRLCWRGLFEVAELVRVRSEVSRLPLRGCRRETRLPRGSTSPLSRSSQTMSNSFTESSETATGSITSQTMSHR